MILEFVKTLRKGSRCDSCQCVAYVTSPTPPNTTVSCQDHSREGGKGHGTLNELLKNIEEQEHILDTPALRMDTTLGPYWNNCLENTLTHMSSFMLSFI